MEDPVTGDCPVRGGIAEEEEEALSYASAFLEPPNITIIAEGPAASVLMTTCVEHKQPIGQIDLPQIIPEVAAALPRGELASHSATIYEVEVPKHPDSVIMIACPKAVLPARAVAWTRAVLAAVQPCDTVVISAMSAAEFRGDGDAAEDVVLLSLPSTAAKESLAGCGASLPAGGLLAGLPAAILAHCEVRGEFAVVMVGVQMSPVPDQVYLKGLVSGIERLVKRVAGGMLTAAFDSRPSAIRQAAIRCDRAYRGSAANLLYT